MKSCGRATSPTSSPPAPSWSDGWASYQDLLASRSDPQAGSESVFIGQIHSGEIYNQYPQECWLEGTRRWLPGVRRDAVEREFRGLVDALAQDTHTSVTTEFRFIRDAFRLDPARSAGDRVSVVVPNYHGARVAAGPEAVRGRRQQLLRPGPHPRHYARPARRRTAHRQRMDRDRRHGTTSRRCTR